jgi:hypothetical protein
VGPHLWQTPPLVMLLLLLLLQILDVKNYKQSKA